jgi:hypothetical protein
MDERNVIYRMRFLGHSDAEIARCLGRHRSTISRECKRNALPDGRYESGPAQTWAHVRRRAHLRRPKTGDPRLMAYVGARYPPLVARTDCRSLVGPVPGGLAGAVDQSYHDLSLDLGRPRTGAAVPSLPADRPQGPT